jgi:amidophosphoribosyltransferase
MNGTLLQAARGRMGEILAREAPAPGRRARHRGARLAATPPPRGSPRAPGCRRTTG